VLLWSLPAALAPGVAGAVPGAAATPTTAAPQLANAVLPTVFPGYTVLASGPLTVQRFASYAPDPAKAAAAWRTLQSTPGFQSALRSWTGPGSHDGIADVLVAFPTAAMAVSYVDGQRSVLGANPGVTRGTVPGIPGAVRDTFLVETPAAGIEQVVTFVSGRTAATMSFISGEGSTNTTPLTPAEADELAMRQFHLLANSPFAVQPARGGTDVKAVAGWAAIGLATLALAGLVVLVLRRRRGAAAGAGVPTLAGVPMLAGVAGPGGVASAAVGAGAPGAPGAAVVAPAPTPAGWYPEPTGGDGLRYWDGTAWTGARAVPTGR
jgi:hypothetical protein